MPIKLKETLKYIGLSKNVSTKSRADQWAVQYAIHVDSTNSLCGKMRIFNQSEFSTQPAFSVTIMERASVTDLLAEIAMKRKLVEDKRQEEEFLANSVNAAFTNFQEHLENHITSIKGVIGNFEHKRMEDQGYLAFSQALLKFKYSYRLRIRIFLAGKSHFKLAC